jgi:hypothetical protein
MPVTLTCDCGARFEVDDLPPGGAVACPECKHELRAPGRPAPAPPRLSFAALLSPLLALAGAFTLVGSGLAALVGLYALAEIRRQPARLTGAPFALAGVVLGGLLSLATVAAYLCADDLPLDGWLRARAMTGQLEPLPAAQVSSSNAECVFTAPSSGWLKVRGNKTAHPVVGELQQNCDVLLFHPRLNAYLDLTRLAPNVAPPPGGMTEWLNEQFGKPRPPLVGNDDGPNPTGDLTERPVILKGEDLPAVDGLQADERLLVHRRGSVAWRFLVRSYRKPIVPGGALTATVWVARGYAPSRRFAAAEAELRAALDSVRFPP